MGDQCIVFKVEENENLDELDELAELEVDLGTLDNEDWEENLLESKATDDEVIFLTLSV